MGGGEAHVSLFSLFLKILKMPMIMLLTSILIVDYVRIRVTAKPDTTEGRTDRLYSIFEQALYNCLLQPPMNMIELWALV